MYLLFDNNRAFPQEYEASGIFRSEDYSPQYAVGKPARIIEGSFFVSVRGCQSFVEYRVTNAVSHSEFLKTNEAGCILAFDGTNYYQLPVIASNLIPNLPNMIRPLLDTNLFGFTNVFVSYGTIWSGPVPERAIDKLATFWMAFASQCYFRNADPDLIYSPWMGAPNGPDAWSKDHRVRAKWSTTAGPPGLPTNIVHTAKFVFETAKNAGVVSNVIFTVDTVTNLGGMTFPEEFKYQSFWPVGRLFNSISGKLLTITTNALTGSFVPLLPERTRIIDERFITRTGNLTAYYTHTGVYWPTLSEGESNLLKMPKAVTGSATQATNNQVARITTLVVLGMLTVAPIVFLAIKHIKTKTERNKK